AERLELARVGQAVVPEEKHQLFEPHATRELLERVAGDDELAFASIDPRKARPRRDDALQAGNVRARHAQRLTMSAGELAERDGERPRTERRVVERGEFAWRVGSAGRTHEDHS